MTTAEHAQWLAEQAQAARERYGDLMAQYGMVLCDVVTFRKSAVSQVLYYAWSDLQPDVVGGTGRPCCYTVPADEDDFPGFLGPAVVLIRAYVTDGNVDLRLVIHDQDDWEFSARNPETFAAVLARVREAIETPARSPLKVGELLDAGLIDYGD